MAISGLKWCDFVVYTTLDIHVERIHFDEKFWMECLTKLTYFLKNALIPELLLRRVKRNQDLYTAGETFK